MTQSAGELRRNAGKQLRVPAGNGPLSGRFVDDPRTSVDDLADKLEKAGSPAAPRVRAAAARLADLSPGNDAWFTGIDEAVTELQDLDGLDEEAVGLVDEVVERLYWLQIANWTDDFAEEGDFSDDEDWDNEFPVDWPETFPAV